MGNKLLILLLAFCFIAAVFAYGTDQHYDAWAHMEKIIAEVDHAPSLEAIVEYWTKDEFKIYHQVKGNGAGGWIPETVRPNYITDGSWGVFEPVQSFFGVVKGFFVRLFYTLRWVIDVIVYAFRMVGVIAPWNGYVKG